MRLNFSYSAPEQIYEGIARLGRVIQEQMAGQAAPIPAPPAPALA
jgi:hypothetical protein